MILIKAFGELIYTTEKVEKEIVSKSETHKPRIEAPDVVKENESFTVKVNVGPHPNTLEHSIRSIEVYYFEEGRKFNSVNLAKIFLAPIYTEPNIELTLKLKRSGILYVLNYCNIHGIWECRKSIKVK